MNTLWQGDCLELMKNIPPGSIDLILCDPPYEITDCKWDSIIPFTQLWPEYKRIIKSNGAILLFSNQPFTSDVVNSNRRDYRYNWYWIKNNITGFSFAKYQPMRCIEDICVFYERMPTYNPQGIEHINETHKKRDTGKSWMYKKNHLINKSFTQKITGYPRNVLYFDTDANHGNRLHNTQKPVALLEYFIKTYTNYGETVLDNCMGSGTTGVACTKTGRDFFGIELEEDMYKTAAARIKEAEAQAASNLFDIVTMNEGGKIAPPSGGGGGFPAEENYFFDE